MHILLIPSDYCTADAPWRGTFVRDDARALAAAGQQVGIAYVERRAFGALNLFTAIRQRFQTKVADEAGIPTVRIKGWTTSASMRQRLTCHAVREYVRRYGVPDVLHAYGAAEGAARTMSDELQRPYVATNGGEAVDCDYFHPPARRRRGGFTFLTIGELTRRRRLDVLIDDFARLNDRTRGARLVIAGDGPDARRLRTLADLSGADVRFTGALPRWGVRAAMWNASALLLPSDYILEAEATGLPVVDGVHPPNSSHSPNAVRRRYGFEAAARRLCAMYGRALQPRQEVA